MDDSKNRYTQEISQHLMENSNISMDYFVRETCHKLVNDLPLEYLKELFNVRFINPQSEEWKDSQKRGFASREVHMKMENLRMKNTFEIEVELSEINLKRNEQFR